MLSTRNKRPSVTVEEVDDHANTSVGPLPSGLIGPLLEYAGPPEFRHTFDRDANYCSTTVPEASPHGGIERGVTIGQLPPIPPTSIADDANATSYSAPRVYSLEGGNSSSAAFDDVIPVVCLNRRYTFKSVCPDLVRISEYDKFDNHLRLVQLKKNSVTITDVVRQYEHFTANDLRSIASAHGIQTVKWVSKLELQQKLLQHTCITCPSQMVYIFKSLSRDRKTRTPKIADLMHVEAKLKDRKSNKMKQRHIAQGVLSEKAAGKQKADIADISWAAESSRKKELEMLKEAFDTENFPYRADRTKRDETIIDWQNETKLEDRVPKACAVCRKKKQRDDIVEMEPDKIDFKLLQNEFLPEMVQPNEYNFVAYERAILYHKGLHNKQSKGVLDVCKSCQADLRKGKQPLDSIANFQYYAYERLPSNVSEAFNTASMFDLMLVSRCRATRITHLFTKNPLSPVYGRNHASSQRYNQGNVAILPQDSAKIRDVLPPDRTEIEESMCVLFVGDNTIPTAENIKKLSPVMVSKSRCSTMIKFLTSSNGWYHDTSFSQANLDALFRTGEDESVPDAVEIANLPSSDTDGLSGASADYTGRNIVEDSESESPLGFVMEAVGYTDGDRSPQSYEKMKAKALAWCLDKKKFIKMQSESRLLTDKHPGFLAYLFPHLDPWGIGGFNEPRRTKEQQITFGRQLRNLLEQDDTPFEDDPNLAFVCWNILQKMEVNRNTLFRVSRKVQTTLANDLRDAAPLLSELVMKWELNPNAKPSNRAEKRAIQTLNSLRMVAKDLKGSSGYKLCRRNEIRAMMRTLSSPALFITLNPSDISHPLVAVLAGEKPETWLHMTKEQRKMFVARHPGAAARFFDIIVKTFIKVVLRYGQNKDGYFGRCTGYYGMVEAQGKGTLHLHMLVWLAGNPSPQELRDRMAAEPEFKTNMFQWLESIIKCELPGMTEPLKETKNKPFEKPKRPAGVLDPRLRSAPVKARDQLTDDEFEREFQNFVNDLAIECNWHEHTDTCWKHLKGHESRDDAHCRMRIDGTTRALTELDPETMSIMLRRLHPRINNFNDLIIFLLQCNMDIKYIGSGAAAKALIYYISDYITKSSLPTHVGMSALKYAVKQNEIKFEDVEETTETKNKSLLTKSVNSMMGRQETSHQQVMSYLIGGGDYYCSHSFHNLKYGDFDRHIKKEIGDESASDTTDKSRTDTQESEINGDYPDNAIAGPSRFPGCLEDTGHRQEVEAYTAENNPTEDDDENDQQHDLFTIDSTNGTLTLSSQIRDYQFRSEDVIFDSMSLWEMVESVEHTPLAREEQRLEQTGRNLSKRRPGPVAAPRGKFASEDHPKYSTHAMRCRTTKLVPVMLGPTLPRRDRGPEEYEQWCRAMLILFKPWRNPSDLKLRDQKWSEAFESWEFTDRVKKIMRNMNLEHECKDARDEYSRLRREGKISHGLVAGAELEDTSNDADSLEVALLNDDRLDAYGEYVDSETDSDDEMDTDVTRDKKVDNRSPAKQKADEIVHQMDRHGLFSPAERNASQPVSYGTASEADSKDKDLIQTQRVLMKKLKKLKRPSPNVVADNSDPNGRRVRRRLDFMPSRVDITELHSIDKNMKTTHIKRRTPEMPTIEQELENIIDELGIRDNPEQERAVRIVGEHFILRSEEQLLMYLGGGAGTGKSYVIKAIVELFKRCGYSDELLVSAPTGCAAILIEGYTIHALTFLPKSDYPLNQAELETIWKTVKYLIIDEVSMIGALFMSQVSQRICKAKGWDPTNREKPFGGVNVIFCGDFAQLPPVRALSLFSHKLVGDTLGPEIVQKDEGQSAYHGAYLWRMVNKVVLLTKNMRSKLDPEYANLLNRIRFGQARKRHQSMSKFQQGDGKNYSVSDYETLSTRRLGVLAAAGVPVSTYFTDAPVIVAEKSIRDAVNVRLAENFTKSTGQELHFYYSNDRYGGKLVTGEQRKRLWQVSSTVAKDALGRLPLVPGMKVMVTENVAVSQRVANGSEGTLVDIRYTRGPGDVRIADCAYVRIPGCGLQAPGLPLDVVPITPVRTGFKYYGRDGSEFAISRYQLPLVPSYAYTDYKSQGRGLQRAIAHLDSCKSLQSVYVMLSRVKTLAGLGILTSFRSNYVEQHMSEAFRKEFARLDDLDMTTLAWYANNRTK